MICEKCGVHLTGERNRCPLCGRILRETGEEDPVLYPIVPLRTSYNLIFKISTFVAILCIVVINIINSAFIPHLALYIPLTISTVCAWLVINIGYKKRKNIPKNILYLALISIGLCVLWDYMTDWRGWSLNYVMPIILGSLHVFYFVMSLVDRRNASAYRIYFLISMVGALLTGIFFLCDVITVRPFAAISIGAGIGLLCFQLIFRWRSFSSELSSRFHV